MCRAVPTQKKGSGLAIFYGGWGGHNHLWTNARLKSEHGFQLGTNLGLKSEHSCHLETNSGLNLEPLNHIGTETNLSLK